MHRLSFGATTWLLEPQVSLGAAEGVGINTRPDFLLRPVTAPPGARPVAVYCDSIAFHVQPKKSIARIADDIGKRQAILGSGAYWVWSVTWKDVIDFEERNQPAPLLFGGELDKAVAGLFQRRGLSDDQATPKHQSMALLIAYLKNPSETRWTEIAKSCVAAAILNTLGNMSAQMLSPVSLARLERAIENQPELGNIALLASENPRAEEVWGWVHQTPYLTALARIGKRQLSEFRLEQAGVWLRLDDRHVCRGQQGFEADWRGFLLAWNLLQFHPDLQVTSSERVAQLAPEVAPTPALTDDLQSLLASIAAEPVVAEAPQDEAASADDADGEPASVAALIDEYMEPELKALLIAVARADLPIPGVGLDIHSPTTGRWVANADLVWEATKVAVMIEVFAEPEDVGKLRGLGWTVLMTPVEVDTLAKIVTPEGASGGSR